MLSEAKKKEKKKDVKKQKSKLSDVVKAAYFDDCGCGRFCLHAIGGKDVEVPERLHLLSSYMRSWHWMNQKEHKRKFTALLEGMTENETTPGGDRRGELSVTISGIKYRVCPKAFAKVHCRGHTYYDKVSVMLLYLLKYI